MSFELGDASVWLAMALSALAGAVVPAVLARRRRRLAKAAAERGQEVEPDFDTLTGLARRPALERTLHELDQQPAGAVAVSALYAGVDGFRLINDAQGRHYGDALLAAVARALGEVGGPSSTTYRLAGDEFLLWLQGDLAQAEALARRIAEDAMLDLQVDGGASPVSISVGVAATPEHGVPRQLVSRAQAAMRHVKRNGGGGYAVFDPGVEAAAREERMLARDLRHAVERKELELYYQPKIDAHSLQVTAVEALLRWKHPTLGMVSPAKFIPIAEKHGLIATLGNWVLDSALAQAAVWRKAGMRMRVAINVSGYQMRQDDFAQRLERGLKSHGLAAGRFTVEVTESVAMEDTEVTRAAFARLQHIGLHVSVDDFGTGHSSLASLRRLPASELKIDRAFVCDVEHSGEAQTIVKAIVGMAHTLGLRVVAEGVETEDQRDFLVDAGCDELQGYLFAKPMNARAITLWAMDAPVTLAQSFRPSIFKETMPVSAANSTQAGFTTSAMPPGSPRHRSPSSGH
jgi:diguanylate cyclase (GGDEF)-like protein